ncbi:hypothetical protein E3O47_01200 [Cryobacterium sp. TMT2-17-1]|uniref:hypothetical protein n=1 Tax=Cryobacterium sp. TMT2-17-1 TaxID=1259248 RepID=UPI00106C352E|nr:hypothetical protein [Cryobacterium sp. TMT2-17-1]TFC54609.1 hypothetical protein E3O47_01200 [Cryobacterium sp. TMT2-17-1]
MRVISIRVTDARGVNVVMSRSDRQSFGLAVEELRNANLNSTHLCSPFLRVLPVTGVAISTLGAPFGAETVCASDVEGVFAFPMVVGTSERRNVGTLDIGAVDLYSRRPRTPTRARSAR